MLGTCSTPDLPPPPLAAWAQAALDEIGSLAVSRQRLAFDAVTLMGERASLMGLPQPGRVSAGGACRLVECAQGTIALSLPRADDWDLLPALFESPGPYSWAEVERLAAACDARQLVERARVLGLAAARADLLPLPPAPMPLPQPRGPAPARPPVVLDLTALWAGPLAGHLLERGGAHVIKVESPGRTDGARRGHAGFYALLNQNKLCITADLATAEGRERLLALIARADIVLESTRPRALRQFGIDAAALVAARPGLTWVSITAHGHGSPEEDWAGFGDDAAAAAGLCAAVREAIGKLAFIGDALADPLTGIAAARAAWQGWRSGGGGLIGLSLHDNVALAMQYDREAFADEWKTMFARAAGEGYPAPRLREAEGSVAAVGAHDDWPPEVLLAC